MHTQRLVDALGGIKPCVYGSRPTRFGQKMGRFSEGIKDEPFDQRRRAFRTGRFLRNARVGIMQQKKPAMSVLLIVMSLEPYCSGR
jgi:hypothetical protein